MSWRSIGFILISTFEKTDNYQNNERDYFNAMVLIMQREVILMRIA